MSKRNKTSDIIDIRGIVKQYISKWYLFVISIFVCVAIAFFYCYIRNDEYGVRANVLIQQEDANPLSALSGDFGSLFGTSGEVNDEIFVISSHSIYRDVMRDLGLNKTHYVKLGFMKKELAYPEFPIDVLMPDNVADTLRSIISFKVELNEDGLADINVKAKRKTLDKAKNVKLPYSVETPYGKFTVVKTEFCPPKKDVTSTILVTGYHAAAEEYALDIYSEIANKKSNVIEMAYNTTNYELGEALLADIIKKYNLHGIKEKNMQGKKTAEFIEKRLGLLMEDLSDAEGKIQNYKEKQSIVDLEVEVEYQTKKKAEVEKLYIPAKTNLEVIKMIKDFLLDPANKYELVPMTVDSEGLVEAIQKYNDLLISRDNAIKTVSSKNEALKRLDNRIAATRQSLLSTIEQAYKNAEVAVNDLYGQMNTTSGSLGKIPNQERTYIDMERQRRVKQELYLFLLERQEENAILLANATPKGLVVDEPYTLSKPLGLKKIVVLFIAFILGLCIPPVYIYLAKLIRNKVESREDIEKNTNAPILGEMCNDRSGNHLVVSPTSTSSATELFRLLRASLMFMLNDANDKVVLLTSSTSGEGKSFISMNLAASFALLDKKVLLVGMDIRAPRLAEYIDIHPQFGLTQYLSSTDIPLNKIITKSPVKDIPGLDVIVAGPIPPNPAELIASKKVDMMFSELRKEYDYIFVDSAPVGLVSDTFSLDRIADSTIYVTRLDHTSATDVSFIDDIYEDKRLKKLSIVVNGVKSKKTYGYGERK